MSTTEDTSNTENPEFDGHPTADGGLPEVVDWVAGAIIALAGLLSLTGGSALLTLVDREALAEGIESGTVTVTVLDTELTEPETLDVAEAVVSWAGAGLLVTGLAMVLFAVGYVFLRRRARKRAGPDDSLRSYGAHAVLGALASVVFSFLPFSPAFGGALAGYLERGESDRTASVGALSGFLAVAPLLVLLVFVLGGLVTGMRAIGQGELAAVTSLVLLFATVFAALISSGLGALGGYLGGRFAES
ncbi:MAG: DUF5518 domain-containing protein [Halovenus sp.]